MSVTGLAGFVVIVAVFITAWWCVMRIMFDGEDLMDELRHDPIFFVSVAAVAAAVAVAVAVAVFLAACGVWLLFVHMVFPASVR